MKTFDFGLLHYVHGLIEVEQDMHAVRNALHSSNKHAYIDHGAYATVYDLGDYVLKVGVDLHSDGYQHYVEYIREHPEYQQFMPEIVYHQEFPGMDGFITVMPKLRSVSYDSTLAGVMLSNMMDVFDHTPLHRVSIATVRHIIADNAGRASNNTGNSINTYIKDARSYADMFEMMYEVAQIADANCYALDLHDGNFMQTTDGRLLLTDPWCC